MITKEDELERIQKSFVSADDNCPPQVACLLTVLKYYRVTGNAQRLKEKCTVDGKITMMGMRDAAIDAGLKSSIGLLGMERLSKPMLPQVLFCYNDLNQPGYVVCYGLFNGRFIIWDPAWGVLHYWPNEMEHLWIKGITLFLHPSHELLEQAAPYAWWELPPYKEWRRKIMRWHETAWLNMPLYRKVCQWFSRS